MKRAKLVLMVAILVIILSALLSGCHRNYNVISKWDASEIMLYTDEWCEAAITVQITDGEKNYTLKKEVNLSSEEVQTISIEDFQVAEYFGEDAKFISVRIDKTYRYKPGEVLLGIFILLIVLCAPIAWEHS